MSADDGPGQREIAYRVFAAEYDDCTVEHKESDEERAPNYVVSPTGARLNRLFAVGVLTEVEQVNEDTKRARVVDPTGAFVVYAGQYQPDAVTALERIDAPAFVAVTGKANTFSPDDSDRVFTSIRPESINEVDADTRDRWTVTTAEHTLARVATMADALARDERGTDLRAALEAEGVEPGVAAGVPLAIDHYGTTPGYLAAVRDLAIDAAEVVADERDEVRPLSLSPDDRGTESVDLAALASGPDSGLSGDAGATEPAAAATAGGATSAETGGDATADAGTDATAGTTSETTGETSDDPAADAETAEAANGDAATTDTAEAAETVDTAEAAGASGDDATTETADAGETAATDEADAAGDTADVTDTADDTAAAAGEPTADDTAAAAGEPTTDATASADDDEAAASPETDGTGPDDDDLGDFEPGGLGDEDGEMYEMDEEERQQVKEEHGVEFSTGNEVSDPGEADIDAPDPGELDEGEAADEAADAPGATDEATSEGAATTDDAGTDETGTDEATADEADAGETGEAADDADAADEAAADADADPEDVLMDAMRELNDGDGAPREELVATVAERTGADEDAVEDAIQDALMGGQCYESGDDRLTPI